MTVINANKVLDESSFRPIHWVLFLLLIQDKHNYAKLQTQAKSAE